jgi:aromatic ring-opening dioxygenase catalytic subunit (LigB family)
MPRAPVLSISHGGGPLPLLDHPSHTAIIKSFKTTIPRILRLGTPDAPRGIVVVTAHWEERNPTISGGAKPSLYYDYGGFPPAMYDLNYDAPGSPDIAREVHAVFEKAGFKPKLDMQRGWDHGVFVPFMLISPAGDVPLIQVSVLPAHTEAPADLYAMGRALAQLREANIAIVGSGLPSMHNMQLLRSEVNESTKKQIEAFGKALDEAVSLVDVEERGKALEKWRAFPGANLAHPPGRAEHFFPLIVCAGAAGDGQAKMWIDEAFGYDMSSHYWE